MDGYRARAALLLLALPCVSRRRTVADRVRSRRGATIPPAFLTWTAYARLRACWRARCGRGRAAGDGRDVFSTRPADGLLTEVTRGAARAEPDRVQPAGDFCATRASAGRDQLSPHLASTSARLQLADVYDVPARKTESGGEPVLQPSRRGYVCAPTHAAGFCSGTGANAATQRTSAP